MGKDRIIILLCLTLMAGLLSGAGMLMPRINHMRADLKLTAHDEVMQNLPPEIALTQAALGSFRGLAVDILWGRVQKMQADGNLYEAMQLADWITKLQPRFTQVWVFHAWNMSYNISVTTATPQERWMWVQAGMKLLRDEAIPLNPQNVQLHRELGWIYLNKIGMYSDDMHWHYKAELASEWHLLLGEPPVDAETDEVVAWFKPVADMYEAYVNERELGYAVREELERIHDLAIVEDHIDEFHAMTIQQLNTRLRTLMNSGDSTLAEALEPLQALTRAQIAAAQADPVERVRAGDAEVAEQLDRLRERGFRPDRSFLRRIAQIQVRDTSVDLELMNVDLGDLSEVDQWLRDWLNDEELEEVRNRLFGFVRARVIYEEARMDPIWMFDLMRGGWFATPDGEPVPIPIDWRHPAAHGMYWSSLGVRRSSGLLRPEDFMVLNTDRQVTQSLQALTRTGDLIFDPATRYYRVLPDPRYIDAYHANVLTAAGRLSGDYLDQTTAPDSFKSGHENFLSFAVQQSYFYGDMDQSRRYYRMLRELYSDFRPDRAQRYQQTLDEFVTNYFMSEEAFSSMDDVVSHVTGYIMQAIDEGLANGRSEISDRYLGLAQRAHRVYNARRAEIGRNQQGQDRLMLPSYEQMLVDTFTRYLVSPPSAATNPLMKARAWRNAPDALKVRVFDRVRDPLYQQAEQSGLSGASMYPPPEGMAAYREQRGQTEEQRNDGLESRPDRK
ncbi:MAG: hypothetical protein WD294_15980 [Phycisphaeraceae bacterium]